ALHVPSDNKEVMGDASPYWQGRVQAVPVNGYLYAFNRASGKLAWFHALDHQQIMLGRQEDLPLLICTCLANRMVGPVQSQTNSVMIRAIDKRTGKQFFSQELVCTGNTTYGPFHTVQIDRRTGAVELVSQDRKIRFQQKQ